jgi:hypothetical protein
MSKYENSKGSKEKILKKYIKELREEEEEQTETDDSGIECPPVKGKHKKPYILTDKRKEQFDKARSKRMENIELKKKEREKENENYLLLKANLEKKKKQKEIKKQQKEIAKLALEADITDEEEVIIKKKKPKKKIVVVESESDDEIVYKKKSRDRQPEYTQPPPIRQLKPVRYL